MKKLITAILTILMALSVVGCSNEKGKTVIGVAQSHLNSPYRVALKSELESAIKEAGLDWEIILTDGQSNPAKQTSDVEDLIQREVDLIIMAPIQAEALAPVAKKVMDAKIPLLLVDRSISTDDFTAFVGGDNINAGKVIAEYIEKNNEGEVNVIEVQGALGTSSTNNRHQGFTEELAKYDRINLLDSPTGEDKRDKTLSVTEDMLQTHSAIDAIYIHSDNMALGSINPIASAGRTENIMVFGTDGQKAVFDLIKQGTMTGTAFYPTGAKEAVEIARKILAGENYERITMLDTPLITKENVDEWYDRGF